MFPEVQALAAPLSSRAESTACAQVARPGCAGPAEGELAEPPVLHRLAALQALGVASL